MAQEKISFTKHDFIHFFSPAHQAFLKISPEQNQNNSLFIFSSSAIANRQGLPLKNNKVIVIKYYPAPAGYDDRNNFLGPILQSILQEKQLRQMSRK